MFYRCSRIFRVLLSTQLQNATAKHGQKRSTTSGSLYRHSRNSLLLSAVPFASLFLGDQADKPKEPAHITTMKRAILSTQRDQLETADHLLHVALRAASECGDQAAISRCHSLMADLAIRQSQWKKAERLLRVLLERHAATHGTDHLAFLGASYRMALTFLAQGRRDEAVAGLQFCEARLARLETQCRATPGGCDTELLLLLGVTCERLALLTADLDSPQPTTPPVVVDEKQRCEALRLMKCACSLRTEVFGETDGEAIRLQNDLATVEALYGHVDEAKKRLEQAICLIEQLPDSEQLKAACLVNLGRLQLQTGQLDRAEDSCSRAVKLAAAGDSRSLAEECLKDVRRAGKKD